MPRKLRNPKLRAAKVPQCVVMYLLTGDAEADAAALLAELLPSLDLDIDEADNVWLKFTVLRDDSADLAHWWEASREPLMAAFVNAFPGSRPFGWWLFDAPRWRRADLPQRLQGLGDGRLKQFAEPRRRLDGVGDPNFLCLNYWPRFQRGLPVDFIDAYAVDLYNGRCRDVNGKQILPEHKEGDFRGRAIDPTDPPQFESEASYLARHSLFVKGERARLAADAFEPDVLALDDDADDEPAA